MAKKKPKATHQGDLIINDIEIPSYNLDSGERVLSRIGFLKAIGRTGKAKGGRDYDDEFKTPIFVSANNLKPYINKELEENSAPIIFTDLNGNESIGYKAELLPTVCYVYIDALEDGELNKNQLHIAERAKILIRGFATVGIIALIDEATGYQYERERDALQKILTQYINEELLPWQKTFPDEFYRQIFRLKGWDYTTNTINKRPGVIGHWTNSLIYKQLPVGVLEELKSKTPKSDAGNYTARLFQSLTPDIGNPHLQNQLVSVITLMRISKNWRDFMDKFNQLFGQTSLQFESKEPQMVGFDTKLKQALEYDPKGKNN